MQVRKLSMGVGAAVLVSGISFGSAYAVSNLGAGPDTSDKTSSWTSPANGDARAECDSLPPELAGDVKVYDQGAGAEVTRNYRDLCHEAAGKAAPAADQQRAGIEALYTYENGEVKITYYESEHIVFNGPNGLVEHWEQGRQLSDEEAQLRLAEARAAGG